MRIPVIKPNTNDPDELRQQLVNLQDNINRVLNNIPYDYSQVIEFRFRPEDFPKLIKNQMPRTCWGLKRVYLRCLTDDTATPMNDVFVDWIPESGGIKIRSISGLAATYLYEARFIAYG